MNSASGGSSSGSSASGASSGSGSIPYDYYTRYMRDYYNNHNNIISPPTTSTTTHTTTTTTVTRNLQTVPTIGRAGDPCSDSSTCLSGTCLFRTGTCGEAPKTCPSGENILNQVLQDGEILQCSGSVIGMCIVM